mgnify:CR=1 FL=1
MIIYMKLSTGEKGGAVSIGVLLTDVALMGIAKNFDIDYPAWADWTIGISIFVAGFGLLATPGLMSLEDDETRR